MIYDDLCESHPDIIANALLVGEFNTIATLRGNVNKYLTIYNDEIFIHAYYQGIYSRITPSLVLGNSYFDGLNSVPWVIRIWDNTQQPWETTICNYITFMTQFNDDPEFLAMISNMLKGSECRQIDCDKIKRLNANYISMVLDAIDLAVVIDSFYELKGC